MKYLHIKIDVYFHADRAQVHSSQKADGTIKWVPT